MNVYDNQHTLINCELSMWSVRGAEIEHSTDTKWFIHCDPLTLVSSAVRTLRETHCHIVTMWLAITDVYLWFNVSISIHCEAAAKLSTWRQDLTSAYYCASTECGDVYICTHDRKSIRIMFFLGRMPCSLADMCCSTQYHNPEDVNLIFIAVTTAYSRWQEKPTPVFHYSTLWNDDSKYGL